MRTPTEGPPLRMDAPGMPRTRDTFPDLRRAEAREVALAAVDAGSTLLASGRQCVLVSASWWRPFTMVSSLLLVDGTSLRQCLARPLEIRVFSLNIRVTAQTRL